MKLFAEVTEESRCSKILLDPGDTYEIGIKIANGEDVVGKGIIKIYDQIFGSYYNIAPDITSTDIERATSEAEELSKLARHLECTHLIAPHGNALLQYRQVLYEAILDDALRYLLLAIATENDFVYTESLIHLVGTYPYRLEEWTSPTLLSKEILRLIVKKMQALEAEALEIERELLLLTIITRPRKEPYRCDVSSQFDTWFVVQLFRDTLANGLRQTTG